MEPTPDAPTPPTTPPASPAAVSPWIVDATLGMVLAAHLLSTLAMRLTAKAMPVFALQACVFGPLGVLVALLGAREFVRRASIPGAPRRRLGVLVLLAGAASILPAFAPRHLEAGALRDLARAGGAAKVVAEGRALLEESAEPRALDLGAWPAGRALGIAAEVRRTPTGPVVFVEAFRLDRSGAPSGFLIFPPDAPPQGRPLAEGLAWTPW